jgi:uncharacterized protein (TIGR03067 family)
MRDDWLLGLSDGNGNKYMRTTRNILGFIFIAALLCVSGCSTLPKSDLAALQGTWKGQEIGPNKQGSRCLIISGNTIEFQGADNDDWCRGTFTVREDTNPRQIVGTVTECHSSQLIGKTACAIYRLEGDTLSVAGFDPGVPGVPCGFDVPRARHFVLKRN